MRAPAVSLLSELAERVNVAEIFAAIDVDDYRRVKRRRIGIIPEKKLLTIALEGDFDQMRQALLRPRTEAQEFLAATANELLGTHLL
jgi:hypothetical protein